MARSLTEPGIKRRGDAPEQRGPAPSSSLALDLYFLHSLIIFLLHSLVKQNALHERTLHLCPGPCVDRNG